MSERNRETPGVPGGEEREFAQLLVGHANRELTGSEVTRLQELTADHPERADKVRSMEQVHELFEQERAAFEEVVSPSDPKEEADETYRRLQLRAAEGEELLRARLLHGVQPAQSAVGGRRPRTAWILGAVAAAVLAGFFLTRGGGGPPELLPGDPGPQRLGPAAVHISLTAGITADNRQLSWVPVAGAATYDVVVENGAGNVVLQRGDAEARSTRWELSEAQLQLLQERAEGLILRVLARDGAGIVVGTTGDLPLSIR